MQMFYSIEIVFWYLTVLLQNMETLTNDDVLSYSPIQAYQTLYSPIFAIDVGTSSSYNWLLALIQPYSTKFYSVFTIVD